MATAFFDLDKTLISKNSGTLWLKSEMRQRRVSPWLGARAATWLLRYRLGFVGLEAGVELAIAHLAGQREEELIRRVNKFYEREIQSLYRPGAKVALDEHRNLGDQLVLLTSASCYLSDCVLDELRLDSHIASRFEVDDQGVFTGKPLGAICFGSGKLTHALGYAKSNGTSLEDCAFYTDSMADLPVLEAVGHPVVVNPDPRLKRTAERNGWPIKDWGVP